ncbi:hypothetical protein P153DRAFT_279506 [Dothidotthia symphoricarpi CBS 119687]|uniref:Camp independent regulatory protein n=1 Tax=Dothidotthia symphoricarpi CBS 119687 TaxID=1392245 RepID=A0A6A6ARJ5_9PLEO|nr:uncharacterized protein P153DRAFT_279506 [Dothidotthia symphoricarpi CBS 119687]KAF2134440.1 hypothetical protein P153DRAFT_279506 [Dothidotthia symphoricarpi CBS 119687]
METYHGHVRTPNDAIVLFEACRIGILPRVQRRLSEKERQQIKSGSVFVWDEREAGMRRWTDGKSWSASRVSGSFLTYREMEGKRGGSAVPTAPAVKRASAKSPDDSATGDSDGEGPDGYRYKADGLMKQSFSITTSGGQHLHLISYYSRSNSLNLAQPTNDAQLRHIRPPKNMYPEASINEVHAVPPVTRGPMPPSPYSAPAHSLTPTSPYARPGPGPAPAPGHGHAHSHAHAHAHAHAPTPPMYAVPVYPPTPPNGTPPLHAYYTHNPYFYSPIIYAQPPYHHPQAHAHAYDRPPPAIASPPGHPMLAHHAHAAYAAHAAHAAAYQSPQYMQTPPARAPSTAELAQHQSAPPPPHSAPPFPEQGPQLPAINGSAAADKPPTPEPDKSHPQPTADAPTPRPLPTLGSLLNGDGADKEAQNTSRSGSRSPNTATRFPRDLAPERLAKNSSAADSNALNKLNSVFVRS